MSVLNTISIVMAALLVAFSASAGGRDGGGGHGTFCGNQVRLLDYQQSQWGYTLNLGGPELKTVELKLDYILKRLAKVNPNRAKSYQDIIAIILNPKNFVPMGITNLSDAGGFLIPPGCHGEVQIAFQRNPVFSGDQQFTINSKLWDLMPINDRVGLLLHEAIYYEYLSNHSEGSGQYAFEIVAHFNFFLSSSMMNNISLNKYYEIFRNSRISSIIDTKNAIPINIASIQYTQDTQVLNFENVISAEIFPYPIISLGNEEPKMGNNTIGYYFAGKKIRSVFNSLDYRSKKICSSLIFDEHCSTFNKDGTLKLFAIPIAQNFPWGNVQCGSLNEKTFNIFQPNSQLAYLSCSSSDSIITINGSQLSCDHSDVIKLDLNTMSASCVKVFSKIL